MRSKFIECLLALASTENVEAIEWIDIYMRNNLKFTIFS